MLKKIVLLIMPALACLLILVTPCFSGDSGQKTEYTVKGAYLMNFLDYVEWPAEAFSENSSPYIICILGKTPLAGALERMSDRIVRRRRVVVYNISTISEIKECHVLFISTSENENLPKILSYLKMKSVLTVSESKNFIHAGGMIGFVNQGNTIRFEINSKAAQQANIDISSYLLKLSNRVTR